MKIAASYILLNDVHIRAYHGVIPQERQVGGDFSVTLRVGFDVSRAVASDDVADTLSYAELYNIVVAEMNTPSALLEHVAGRIAHAIELRFPQTESIDLTITKLNPPMGAESSGAGVNIHWLKST